MLARSCRTARCAVCITSGPASKEEAIRQVAELLVRSGCIEPGYLLAGTLVTTAALYLARRPVPDPPAHPVQ